MQKKPSEEKQYLQEWSDEKLQSLVAEADVEWEKYRYSKKAAGLLAFAHLMKPQESVIALRLAAMFSMRNRDDEAVRLADFAMRQVKEPAALEAPSLHSYLRMLANCYLRTGNHGMALRLATCAQSEDGIKKATRAQRRARQPRIFHFPHGPLAMALENRYGCETRELYPSYWNVEQAPGLFDEKSQHTRIGWIRSEADLQELTPDRLGVMTHILYFVCSSEFLRGRFLSRLPFIGEDRVKVILDTPLAAPVEVHEPEMLVIYRGHPSGLSRLKEEFDDNWVISSDPEDKYIRPALFVLHTDKPSTLDIAALIDAQSKGAIPVCSAVGAVPEYMAGGMLVKARENISPVFDPEHRKVLCETVSRLADLSLSEHQLVADRAFKHFSVGSGAIQWLELINRAIEIQERE